MSTTKNTPHSSRKFDYLTSNPAFNIASENNVAGTGGNTLLYRKATRYDFKQRLNNNGILLNITLKGIIPDLVDGYFKDYLVHEINLMDDIEIWPYNTCYFFVEKENRNNKVPVLEGGLGKKIFTLNKSDKFESRYYSVNNSMMTGYSSEGYYRVIRKLPGKDRDKVEYDFTDEEVDNNPKFAFSYLESQKSYTITNERIFGGTICYISTNTLKEADNLKNFCMNNELYKTYLSRMNLTKLRAYSLTSIKKFDLNQIITGKEIPKEWNIKEEDLKQPIKLHNENIENYDNKKNIGEVFTPKSLISKMFDDLERLRPDAFSNPEKTFCDSMCGNGRFLESVLQRKLKNGIDHATALESIFGCDINPASVKECKEKLLLGNNQLRHIVDKNICCNDTFQEDFIFHTLFEFE